MISAGLTILVTGGAGYIGSHTCVTLLEQGFDVVVVDNLSNASEESLKHVQTITGKTLKFVKGDICNSNDLEQIFSHYKIYAVIHFAGLKAVGESVQKPLEYYENNVGGTVALLKVMRSHNVKRIVFSSSACVYGMQQTLPLVETLPTAAVNPYGHTKVVIEQMLASVAAIDPEWHVVLLRYFNPIGAHPSGLIGEDPLGIPNNLLPYVAQVAIGRHDHVRVFGNDYPTPDGTGKRDYIHVMDLAEGHIAALKHIDEYSCEAFNLGTGKSTSVLEIIAAFGKACKKDIPYKVVDRRAGDVAECYASAEKAKNLLKWETSRSLDDMCESAWKWQSMNPKGFHSEKDIIDL
ncbi:putative UDP-glucose 4-epimerase [Blattamonas nauphoetae]|uniref:UDP-glucose 4-epimerase n=1 Tax=Blattamonas nauphoetae TaxID=2049346 RepID=A0ABQ9XP10_9EUKA|nr:putative UDP-glucose 4-epimerase [Blattamonas nauphoetae]